MNSLPRAALTVFSCLICLLGRTAQAGGVVTALTESNLRAALDFGGTVTFAVDGTITVAGRLFIKSDTVIDGTGHTVTLSGGGAVGVLRVNSGVKLTMKRLTVANGYQPSGLGDGGGAGLMNRGETVVTDCTFSNNVCVTGSSTNYGGAILHTGTRLQVADSLFVGNASTGGSAISCGYPLVYGGIQGGIAVTNCTFYANSGVAIVVGEPIFSPVNFANCTFAWNTNGAITHLRTPVHPTAGRVGLINSIVAHSVGTTNCTGVLDLGHNLSTDASLTSPTSLLNTDPLLNPLADNGGPTWTMALSIGSPALDQADASASPPTDQRGSPRPVGPASDIGAFEGTFSPSKEVRFSSANYFVGEPDGPAAIQIERTGSTAGAVTVLFAASPGTATAQDFFPTNYSVSFADGESAKTVYVAITNDSLIELNETVLLTLSNPIGTALGSPSNATLIILDESQPAYIANCDESGLRGAINNGVRVLFTCDGTITLTSPIRIAGHKVLDANGHNVVLSGNNATRLFNVAPGGSLTLKGLMLMQGRQTGSESGADGLPAFGGAIFVDHAELIALDCQFMANSAVGGAGGFGAAGGAGAGGAIYMIEGTLNSTNVEFTVNTAVGGKSGGMTNPDLLGVIGGTGAGGAIYGERSQLNLHSCSFSANEGQGGAAVPTTAFGTKTGPAYGGALFSSQGTSVVANCTFNGNRVLCQSPTDPIVGADVAGGAVCITNGLATFAACQFAANSAIGSRAFPGGGSTAGSGRGGALGNWGTVDIVGCSFSNNTAAGGVAVQGGHGEGGAVFNAGQVRVRESRLVQNSTQGATSRNTRGVGRGGAIFNASVAEISSSLLFENSAQGAPGDTDQRYGGGFSSDGQGGAIYSAGVAQLTNVTLAANVAKGVPGYQFGGLFSGGANAYGGGICVSNGSVFLVHCTLSSNNAAGGPGGTATSANGTGFGGGVFTTNGTATFLNTLLAGNAGGTNSLLPSNASGPLLDLGHNLSSDSSAAFTNAGSLNNTDPKLGPLADNGGPTLTLALLPGSPAIDTGIAVPGVDLDQRGFQRPFGSAPDIGAFEFGAVPSAAGFSLSAPTQVTGIWQLSLSGPVGSAVRLQESTNLTTWKDIATNAISGEGVLLLPLPSSSVGQRFYRTVSP